MTTKEFVRTLDKQLRDKPHTATDFLKTYTSLLDDYAYAGGDDDEFGKLEKQLTHVLGMLIYYREACKILGYEGDPRELVNEYEGK